MNHCLIQALVKTNPQMRYTKENQTPIAEMIVTIKGLRNDDPTNDLKVLGWGAVAQEMVEKVNEGENIVLEGSLRMNSITRKDGTKEKQAELTVSRIHQISKEKDHSITEHTDSNQDQVNVIEDETDSNNVDQNSSNWNSAPLVPEVDEIPF